MSGAKAPLFFISCVVSRSFFVAFLLHLIALFDTKNIEKALKQRYNAHVEAFACSPIGYETSPEVPCK